MQYNFTNGQKKKNGALTIFVVAGHQQVVILEYWQVVMEGHAKTKV